MANRHPNSQAERYVRRVAAVTCSDSDEITDVTDALLVATAGNYTILLENGGDTAVQMYLAAGIWHPMRVKRVNSTSAASTSGVVAGYDP